MTPDAMLGWLLVVAGLLVIWLIAEGVRWLYGLTRARKRLEAELAKAQDRGPLPPHIPEDQAMLTAWVHGYMACFDDIGGEAAEPDRPAL